MRFFLPGPNIAKDLLTRPAIVLSQATINTQHQRSCCRCTAYHPALTDNKLTITSAAELAVQCVQCPGAKSLYLEVTSQCAGKFILEQFIGLFTQRNFH